LSFAGVQAFEKRYTVSASHQSTKRLYIQ